MELAVGGYFDCDRVGELVRDHQVGAIIDLRDEACDDEELLRRHRVHFLHLPTPDMHGSSCQMLDEGVAFAAAHIAAGRRVLAHCQHGIGRSATLVLCVLVVAGALADSGSRDPSAPRAAGARAARRRSHS